MNAPAPTAAHKKLEAIAGNWIGDEIIHPSPWEPEGGEAETRSSNRIALGGMVLITDHVQKRGGRVSFEGHGVSTYDVAKQRYVMHWFDSAGTPPTIYEGDFDGDVLVLTSEFDVAGAPRYARMVYDLSRGDTMNCRMESSEDGRSWTLHLESNYRRE